jgi:hypothetical protein
MSQVSNGEDSEDSEDAFPAGSTPDPSSAEEIERFKRLLGELGD